MRLVLRSDVAHNQQATTNDEIYEYSPRAYVNDRGSIIRKVSDPERNPPERDQEQTKDMSGEYNFRILMPDDAQYHQAGGQHVDGAPPLWPHQLHEIGVARRVEVT